LKRKIQLPIENCKYVNSLAQGRIPHFVPEWGESGVWRAKVPKMDQGCRETKPPLLFPKKLKQNNADTVLAMLQADVQAYIHRFKRTDLSLKDY